MTKPQNFRERSFAVFQPSIYSAGVRGYPVYRAAGNYGFLPGLDTLSALMTAGSVANKTAKAALDYTGQSGGKSQIEPNTEIWYGYAKDMADPWFWNSWSGPLRNINQLSAKAEMERPSATEAGARLKSAYWLGVAGRACTSDSKGRENLLKMGTQWAEQGRTEGLTEGAINRTNQTKNIYSAALNAVRQYATDEDPEARANSVFASVQGILNRGASDEGQSAALADIKAEQAEDDKTKQNIEDNEPPPPKCEDTFPGNLIPNYCLYQNLWKGALIVTGVVGGLVALRVVVKQAKKTAKAVRGDD